ncbi:MAG: hypothetical protein Q8O01_03725 [Candidatus Omnitrophota bacterium]|nr:hypothetical protein [Candidatus Omnitrophota bacterium]
MKKKTVKKIIYFLILFPAVLLASGWIYMNFIMKIDTAEVDRYYDLLTKHAKPSGDPVFTLDISEDDGLQVMADKLKRVMGLEGYRIWAGYGQTEDRPAFITNVAPGAMTITVSRKVADRREQINVLIHELGHIYVWAMDKSILKDCDEEKFVDCSGVFLGLGIPMLNGLTDDIFFMPGGEYHTEKKMYGYITPEQLGYLLARYCAERDIAHDKVVPFLGSAGRKYFNIGYSYLQRSIKNTGG